MYAPEVGVWAENVTEIWFVFDATHVGDAFCAFDRTPRDGTVDLHEVCCGTAGGRPGYAVERDGAGRLRHYGHWLTHAAGGFLSSAMNGEMSAKLTTPSPFASLFR